MTLMLQEVSLTRGDVEQEAQRPQAQKENPLPRLGDWPINRVAELTPPRGRQPKPRNPNIIPSA